MRVLVLGSGTSSGVPVIGCPCPVCMSSDPRNKRTRASVAVLLEGGTLLIDTSPDLREQALRHGLERIDAVLYTHAHADHIHGVDELRIYNLRRLSELPCYAGRDTAERLRAYLRYIFVEEAEEGFRPHLELHEVSAPFEILGVRVTPVPVWHGQMGILGYRIGDFAYLTDVSAIPEETFGLLDGLELLILGALRERPHPTHFSVGQALAAIERIRPKRAALTHLSHSLEHAATSAGLPPPVELSYDGMVFDLP